MASLWIRSSPPGRKTDGTSYGLVASRMATESSRSFRNVLRDPRGSAAAGQPCESADQRVDIGAGIVQGQGRANGAFHSEAPQDRLSTVISGSHRDSFEVEG